MKAKHFKQYTGREQMTIGAHFKKFRDYNRFERRNNIYPKNENMNKRGHEPSTKTSSEIKTMVYHIFYF